MTLRNTLGSALLVSICIFSGCSSAPKSRGIFSRFTPRRDRDSDEALAPIEEEASTRTVAAREPVLDAATMMLIETELRDLPDAERRDWKAYLSTVEPEMVPFILKARRMEADRQPPMDHVASNSMPPTRRPETQSPSRSVASSTMDPRIAELAGISAQPQSRLTAPEPPVINGTVSPFVGNRQPQTANQAGYQVAQRTNQPTNIERVGAVVNAVVDELPQIRPDDRYTQQSAHAQISHVEPAATFANSRIEIPQATASPGTYWEEELQRLTELIEAEVAAMDAGATPEEKLEYIKRHVWLRMLYLMADQPVQAQQAISGLQPSEQEFWTEMFWALSSYFDVQGVPDESDRASLTVAQLASAHRQLAEQARLELHNTSLCYRIDGFGSIQPFERDEFQAGQPILLYTEVRNFQSDLADNGQFVTRLKSHISIRRQGVTGEIADENTFPATEDFCQTHRTDYYHSYRIDLPQNLAPGKYALVLTVEDELSGKSATTALDLTIR